MRHLRDWQYDESMCKQARELYQRGDSSAKAVMIGAAHTTAFYQKRKFDIVQAECQGIPNSQMRPARPASIGALRLGWPDTQVRTTSESVLRWLGYVRETVRKQL